MRLWLLALALVAAAVLPAEAVPASEPDDGPQLVGLRDRSIEVYVQLAWAGWAFSSGEDRWNPTARAGFGRYRRTANSVRGMWAAYEISALSKATASLNLMYIGRRTGGGYAGVLADLETGRFGVQIGACVSMESEKKQRDRRGTASTFRPCLELQLRDRPDGTALAVILSTSLDVLGYVAALRDR